MNWLDGIEVLSLDAGGTLVEPWPSVGAVYARAARDAGQGDVPADALQAGFVAAWRGRGAGFDYTRAAWASVVRRSFEGLVADPADPRLFAAAYDGFARADAWRVYPDAWELLQETRARGLRVIVVSNWDERLGPLLAALGIAAHVDFVLASSEAGEAKPGRGIFEAARARCGVAAGRMLHAGDGWEEDVSGARACGWRAAWLDRAGRDSGRPGRVATLAALLGPQR